MAIRTHVASLATVLAGPKSIGGRSVVADVDVPNTSGGPSLEDYIQAEASDNFLVVALSPDRCVTASAFDVAGLRSQLLGLGDYYDLELDIGVEAENQSGGVPAANSTTLTSALQSRHAAGAFTFADGRVGPVDKPIISACKEFFFDGPVLTGRLDGGPGLYGRGSSRHALPSSAYAAGAPQGGFVTRFTNLAADDTLPFFVVGGHGFTMGRLQLFGRPYPGPDPTGVGPTSGTRLKQGIAVEGHEQPSSGGHTFIDLMISEFKEGITFEAGTWNGSGWDASETHADNCLFDGITLWGDECGIRSKNIQAVSHLFTGVRLVSHGGSGIIDGQIFLDIARGGGITVVGADLNSPKAELLRLQYYSPNASRTSISGFKQDNYDGVVAGSYIRLLHYVPDFSPSLPPGTIDANDYSWVQFSPRISGQLGSTQFAEDFILIEDGPATVGIDRTDMLFDITSMPTDEFTILGSGPWYYPNH